MLKILLTGATGFIGTNFVLRLHCKYKITAIVRPSSDTSKIDKYCNIYQYDGDIQSLIDFCNQERFDGVVHLAATFIPNHTHQDIAKLLDGNLILGLHILEAIHNLNIRPTFFINTVTFSQFMNSPTYCPKTLYDAMKQALYDLIQYYQNTNHNIIFTHLMLYNPYGPHETIKKIFHLWKDIASKNTTMKMSSGYQQMDITYIDDIIRAYDILIDQCIAKQIEKNIIYTTENTRYTIKELAIFFQEISGKKLDIIWGEDFPNTIHSPISSSNSNQLKKLPKWEPTISLEQGIKNVIKQ